MRDAAESMGRGLNRRLIFYPSDAVVVNMMRFEDIIKVSKLLKIFKNGIHSNVIMLMHIVFELIPILFSSLERCTCLQRLVQSVYEA